MSALLERETHTWEGRPGWGIAVDLTPRELLDARSVKVHQRLVALGLVIVLSLCAGAMLMALRDRGSAQESFDAAQARTTALNAEANSFTVVTTMQRVTAQIQTQLSTLIAQDVDFVNLMAKIRTALPDDIAVNSATVLLAPPATDAAQVVAGRSVIGSVTISGTGDRIRQIPKFVAILNHVHGVVDVVPLSVTQSETGMSFTLSLNITDELYTHRFDLEAPQSGAGAQ